MTSTDIVLVPAGNCMFIVNNRNTRARCQVYSKLTIKTPFWCHYCYFWYYFTPFSSVSILNFEHAITCWYQNDVTWRHTVFYLLILNTFGILLLLFIVSIFCQLPNWYLIAQNQQWKHQDNLWNLFKVSNEDTRTTSLTGFIVKFEQISHLVLVFPLLT